MTREEFYTIEESNGIYNINSKGWYLKGWSRAGLKTGFLLYPFKILIDCGIHTSQKPNVIFLTHQHTDHTQAIPNICSRHKLTKSILYIPESSVKYITKYERAISELSNPDTEKFSDGRLRRSPCYRCLRRMDLSPPMNKYPLHAGLYEHSCHTFAKGH